MKKMIVCFILIFLFFTGVAFAEDEKVDQAIVDPTNQIYQASIINVESLIDGNKSLQDFVTTRAVSGIDVKNKPNGQDNRICPFCWLFAAVFGSYLIQYGKKLKKYKRVPKEWYKKPLNVAVGIYFAHAVIHVYLASSIFLYYYWMILFDELVFAFFYYYNFIILKKKPIKSLSKKTA
jgi:hypothetical protein